MPRSNYLPSGLRPPVAAPAAVGRPARRAAAACLAAFVGCTPPRPAVAPPGGSGVACRETSDYDLARDGAPGTPEASAEDVASPESIVKAVYATTWGPPAQARPWARLRSLVMPGARFVQATVRDESGANQVRVVDLEGFIAWSESFMLKEGFFERETHHTVRQFGRTAHVFSAYETSRQRPDAPLIARGVNSFNLVHDGKRWWIASIVWDRGRAGNPMPATTP